MKSFFLICIIILAVLAFLCLIRTILGPHLTDRIVAGNVTGTITIIEIMLLSVYLDESNILDIALIFAAMSFIAIILLSKIYLGVFYELKDTAPHGAPSQNHKDTAAAPKALWPGGDA